MLKRLIQAGSLAAVTALAVAGLGTDAQAAGKVRVALGDVVSEENLAFIVALERAKDRGVDYELTSFAKEDLAIQAIINGQADVGVGTPYAVIQRSKLPLRLIFQMSRLVFFPVASNEYQSWKDLDGKPFTFHSRGSGTEALGNVIAAREGIKFGERSYVPGSGNRIVAMMKGQIKATIVDLSNKNKLMAMAGDKFHVLPGLSSPVTDEAVFAGQSWIDNNREDANIVVEELLKLWREMSTNPAIVEQERAKRNLLADQPKEVLDEVVPYYTEAIEAGVYDPSGGDRDGAQSDLNFYADAGQLEGPGSALKVEDYWDFGPLDAARKMLGG